MSESVKGRCLCGAVNYEFTGGPQVVGHCYCVDCRKSSGTGHGTHVGLAESNFTLEGDLSFYEHPADSGNIVTRGFCPNCGCAILSRNSAFDGMVFARASSLDDPNLVSPQMIVYRKPRAGVGPS